MNEKPKRVGVCTMCEKEIEIPADASPNMVNFKDSTARFFLLDNTPSLMTPHDVVTKATEGEVMAALGVVTP